MGAEVTLRHQKDLLEVAKKARKKFGPEEPHITAKALFMSKESLIQAKNEVQKFQECYMIKEKFQIFTDLRQPVLIMMLFITNWSYSVPMILEFDTRLGEITSLEIALPLYDTVDVVTLIDGMD